MTEFIVYTGVGCQGCTLLKRLLNRENIPYTERPKEAIPSHLVDKANSLPVYSVGPRSWWGFNPAHIQDAIDDWKEANEPA